MNTPMKFVGTNVYVVWAYCIVENPFSARGQCRANSTGGET